MNENDIEIHVVHTKLDGDIHIVLFAGSDAICDANDLVKRLRAASRQKLLG